MWPRISRFRRPEKRGNSAGCSTIEPDRVDHVGEPARDLDAEHPQPAGGGTHEPEQAPDRRGLARAVRSEEAEHAAFGHLEVEAGDGDRRAATEAAVLLAEPLHLDHVHRRTISRRSAAAAHLAQCGSATGPGALGCDRAVRDTIVRHMRSPSPSPAASTAAPQERPLTGTVLADRYELRALLGRGGMGEVYEAADPVLDRTVAVKVLRPALAGDHRSGARFEREARTAARLSHPRIVAVFDAGRHDDRVFIVMEHVAGTTLVEALRRHGTIAPSTAASIGADIADALAHAHERGVVHRDVTPGNVMLDRDGRAKVLDFGIARAAQRVPSSTSVHGTIAYAAPEVLAGQHGDQRVDVYGLGAVLYELLTGTPPFRGGDRDIDRRLQVRRPVPVRGWDPSVPEDLDALVQRLVAYDPSERPSDLAPVARTLREIAGSPTAAITAPLVSGSRAVGEAIGPPAAAAAGCAIGPRGVARAGPSTPVLVPRTRRLDVAQSPHDERRSAATPSGRRWPAKLGRVVAWIALFGAISGAGAIVVPSMMGVAKPVQATVDAPARLPAPANLTVSTSCDGLLSTAADLAWEPVAGASGYEVWRRGTGDDTYQLAGTVGADVTGARDPDLGIDTTYTYRVRGTDGRVAGAVVGGDGRGHAAVLPHLTPPRRSAASTRRRWNRASIASTTVSTAIASGSASATPACLGQPASRHSSRSAPDRSGCASCARAIAGCTTARCRSASSGAQRRGSELRNRTTLGVPTAAVRWETPVSFVTTTRARSISAASPPNVVRPATSMTGDVASAATCPVTSRSADEPVRTTRRSRESSPTSVANRSGGHRRPEIAPQCTTAISGASPIPSGRSDSRSSSAIGNSSSSPAGGNPSCSTRAR